MILYQTFSHGKAQGFQVGKKEIFTKEVNISVKNLFLDRGLTQKMC